MYVVEGTAESAGRVIIGKLYTSKVTQSMKDFKIEL